MTKSLQKNPYNNISISQHQDFNNYEGIMQAEI